MRYAGEIAQAVVLTSAEIEHTEPLRIEPLDGPVPLEALSGASVSLNDIPGDLGASA
jgi:hypothetical protein